MDKLSNSARDLYARFHQLNSEIEELPEIAIERKERIQEFFDLAPPWSYWYELSWKKGLAIFLVLSGLDDMVIQAAKSDNPQSYIFEYMDQDPDPLNEDDLSDEDKAIFISFFMSILYQMRSISVFSEPLSVLIEKAKSNDDALFDAVVVDRSVVACPSIAKRIQYAQLSNDESFLNSLSKAITKTRPRPPAQKYDDLRFMLEAVDEMKECEGMTIKEKFDLLAVDLELYDVDEKNDSFSGFKRLIERRAKRKAT